jgi:hypothetical protein
MASRKRVKRLHLDHEVEPTHKDFKPGFKLKPGTWDTLSDAAKIDWLQRAKRAHAKDALRELEARITADERSTNLKELAKGLLEKLRDLTKATGGDSVLIEANKLVHGPRQANYGHPLDDFTKTAKMWSAILGIEVKPEQIALCMICVKISRETNEHKRDNLVDIGGYAETLFLLHAERQRRLEHERSVAGLCTSCGHSPEQHATTAKKDRIVCVFSKFGFDRCDCPGDDFVRQQKSDLPPGWTKATFHRGDMAGVIYTAKRTRRK